jgi:hypothetical protein
MSVTVGVYMIAAKPALRWIGLRIDILGGLFSATLAA